MQISRTSHCGAKEMLVRGSGGNQAVEQEEIQEILCLQGFAIGGPSHFLRQKSRLSGGMG